MVMRVTLTIHSLDGGGAERVMASLASRLADRGHAVSLITLDDGMRDRYPVNSAVRRLPLHTMTADSGRLRRLLSRGARLCRLRRAIRATAPDVVLSFCDAMNVLTLLATWGMRVPVVVSERSDPAAQPLPTLKRRLRPRLYRRAADVIVLTRSAADTVAPWCRQPPRVIPSAIDMPPTIESASRAAPESTFRSLAEPRRYRLLAVGRLAPEKGFDRLIDAFSLIAARQPAWDLEIHGEGDQRELLAAQITEQGLTDRIRLAGWTQPIWPALHAADLFVLSSLYEGFPSALLEAMAAGLACVATDCPSGPREIIRSGIDGVLVPPDDPAELAAGLERLMSDEAERRRLGGAARGVTERFGWDAMTDAYVETLQQAMGGPSAGAVGK
ncbi:MAG: glycosyltransferase family 4 protein [Planctomycetaceae bacterium]|nr:MAG: glycosyltransferase family 4 protein [Planctomycetaceae bacterium]